MTGNSEKATGLWSWIGKIATALGLLWVLVQLVRALFPGSEYNIEAYGDYSSVVLPEAILDELDDMNDPPSDLVSSLSRIDSIWWFVIKNEGKKEVTNLILELPFDGLYRATRTGEQPVFSDFQRDIQIGSLRPSHEIEFTVWSYSPVSYYVGGSNILHRQSDETQITHPNGIVYIQYPEKVRGALAGYARLNNRLGGVLPIAILLILLLLVTFSVIGVIGNRRTDTEGDRSKQDKKRRPKSSE